MSKTAIAVMLSALVLPGAGHLYLKRFVPGFVLIAASLISLGVVVNGIMQQTQVVLEQIESEGVIPDATQMMDMAAQASNGSGDVTALLVLAVCWLAGIVDAWRLGKKRDR